MKTAVYSALALIIIASLAGCGSEADLDAEKIALLRIHMADIKAHLEGDVPALMETVGEEFMYVGDGRVSVQSRAEIEEFFTGYLQDATYQRYKDLDVPHAEVSADGTMGWIVSRTAVTRTEPDGSIRSFTYAGIMTYEKVGGRWRKVANVSTFER
jgi:ketosteroid isomerase-like protein